MKLKNNFLNLMPSRLQVKVLTGVTMFIFTFLNILTNFPLVKFSNIKGSKNYGDLLSTLNSGECFGKIGLDVYSNTNTGYCGNYIYGSELLRLLNILNIDLAAINLIGVLSIVMITVAFYVNVINISKLSSLAIFLSVVLFSSPGIALLMERGNIDSFVFLGLLAFVFFAKKDQFTISMIVISIVSVIKFYTFPCMIILLLMQKKRSRIVSGLIVSGLTLVSIINSLQRIRSAIPEGGYAQFGSKILANYMRQLGFPLSHLQGIFLGLITVAALVLMFFRLEVGRSRFKSIAIGRNEILSAGFFSGVTFISCYLAGLNYDYRLIFFVIFSIWLYSLLNLTQTECAMYLILVFSGTWFSTGLGSGFFLNNHFWQRYFVNGVQSLGDLSLCVITAFSITLGVQKLWDLQIHRSVLTKVGK